MGCLYCLLVLTFLLEIAKGAPGKDLGIFDLLANLHGLEGSTNLLMFILVGIPLIVILNVQFIERIEKGRFVLKSGNRFRLWHAQVISAVCISFLMTCIVLAISLLIGGMFVGWQNTWLSSSGTISKMLHNQAHFQAIVPHLATYKVISTLFVTKFLGFMMIAFFTLFLKRWIKNNALIMIVMIALTGIDRLGSLPVPFFTLTATLYIRDWISPMLTVYHCIYLFIVSLVLYGVTGVMYERKDFVS